MRRPLSLLLVVVLAAAGLFVAGFGLAASDSSSVATKLTAKLSARQEIPAPKAAARGTGLFTATLSGRVLTWRLTFVRLTGKALAAHIHLGKAGVAGAVAVPLCGPCVSGVHKRTVVTVKVRNALLHRGAYVNVHTSRNPAGEIRGQVLGGTTPPPPARTTGTTTPDTTTSGTTTTVPY